MKTLNLPIENTIPKIYFSREYTHTITPINVHGRIAPQYEISFYFEVNGGTITINDNTYNIKVNDIRFTKPNTFLNSTDTYSCYTIKFDFGEQVVVEYTPDEMLESFDFRGNEEWDASDRVWED